ncbi:hypothetical protein LCGC14_3099180, partial [marine sediment metagenome]
MPAQQNPLLDLELQVRDLLSRGTPDTLGAAENLIRSFVTNAPANSGGQLLELQKSLLEKRGEQKKAQRTKSGVSSILQRRRTGDRPLSTPSIDDPLKILQQFGPSQEGVEPQAGQPGGAPLLTNEAMQLPPELAQELQSFTEQDIADLQGLLPQGMVKQLIDARNENVEAQQPQSELGGPKILAGQAEAFGKAGINLGSRNLVSEISTEEFDKLEAFEEQDKIRLERRIASAKIQGKLNQPLNINDLQNVVDPETLQSPTFGLTGKQLQEAQKEGRLIIASVKSIELARELQGSIAPLLRLMDLTKKLITAQPGAN